MREKLDDLSPDCRDALLAAADAGAGAERPSSGRVLADLPYGSDPKQRLDVHLPEAPRAAPILVMVHGGAWVIGDKNADAVVDAKVAHWRPRGWIFVTVGYRLLPAADVATQAEDVAHALAYVQAHAGEWGGDPRAVVLMGHSAGAHLAALLAADPSIVTRAGGRPWRGTVALDSAVYDVPAMMSGRHLRLYDRAFGADPATWRGLSPLDRLSGRPAPMLLVCSTRRDESCPQARRFAAAVEGRGGRAEVFATPQSHREINRDLGTANAETAAVDAFLAGLPR
ncbi:MAG: alpha/beta hydrolase [Phyllobacteriaceae bacterium]|nr:alpha/beta hydrolase [Phyllobacteriaceae bacterium]